MQGRRTLRLLGVIACAASAPVSALEWDVGGYLSLAAGKVVSGERKGSYLGDNLDFECPCFIADYEEAGVYEDGPASFRPDSGYGLSVTATVNDWMAVTGQTEGKGGNNFEPDLSALYLRFHLNHSLSLDVGRKALPLYFYSDFINVSYAYPWIRVSGDVYGWPLSSYNGISASYMGDIGDSSYTVSAWYGEEEDKFNRAYGEIYWGSDKFSIKWNDIIGAAFEFNHQWFSLRAVVMQNKEDEVAFFEGEAPQIISDQVKQTFYGLAAIVDYNNVLFQSEYNEFDAEDFDSRGYQFAVGYRFDALTPMVSFSRYSDDDPGFGKQINHTLSYSLRWEFMRSAALTVQYDDFTDKTRWQEDGSNYTFTGDARVFAMGVDYVF